VKGKIKFVRVLN